MAQRRRAGRPDSAEDDEYAIRRAHLAKAETPRALIWISLLIMVLSAANFVLRPEYYPAFHAFDYAAALVLLGTGLWLRRPATPARIAPWAFSACMVVLAASLLVQSVIAQDPSPSYVLLVLSLTGPVALAWTPSLLAAAVISLGVAGTTSADAGDLVVDWTLLAVTAAMTGGVILWLRLGSIREEVRASRALADQSRRLELVLESSRLGVWDWSIATDEMVLDDRWAEILGYRLEELEPVSVETGLRLMHPDDRAVSDALVEQHLRGLIPFYEVDLRMHHRDGRWVWVRDRGTVVERASDGSALRMTGTHEDITERRVASDELLALATHDTLTGLANRASMLDDLGRALRAAQRSERPTAVLMLDLDNFKYVNDTLGHGTGDELLRAAADRILTVVRDGDLVARLGGDEFVVVLRDLDNEAEAMAAAERLLVAFRKPLLTASGNEMYATVSVGVSVAGPDSQVDDLVREADTAMYVAKGEGRDRVALFSEGLRAELTARMSVERDLREALALGQLSVWYQPEVDLVTGRIVAVEALLRWNHPDGTTWTADRFIDVAEETGLIRSLGDWVLLRACSQAAVWAGGEQARPVTVRINVSALQLGEPGFLAGLDEAIGLSGIDPTLVCLEITETVLLRQTATARRNLLGVRERGVHLALDDFGTGHASLTYLRQYPIDLIKIDRSFITNLTTQANDSRIVGGIIALAHSLSIAVTAEGVEDVHQAAQLRLMGCPTAQGYLFSRAVPFDEATALLGRHFLG